MLLRPVRSVVIVGMADSIKCVAIVLAMLNLVMIETLLVVFGSDMVDYPGLHKQ